MKRGFIPILVILLIGCDSKTKKVGVTNLSTFQDTTSYVLGADLGENLRRQNVGLDYDVFMAGVTDGYETGVVQLDKNQRRNAMMALQKHIKEKAQEEGKNNLAAADEFLDKNKNENPDVKETPTGLQYRVLKEGEGNSPGKTDRVKVHYAGRLIDGTEFDSSIKRGEPSSFGLNQVIKGWTEGLQLMKVGSKFEFFIHPKIAYGTRPKPNIPSNSLLIFEVELLEIEEEK
jgi:FKBP-type peptidyl-prolyl cis-trans isomerase